MSKYETHFGKVENSTFAIGKNAKAEGKSSGRDLDDLTETLRVLLDIVSKYNDPAAYEVKNLALAAGREISSGKPEKEVFRRLADATRKLLDKLGPSVIEAGALADAVAKISELIRHL
jgi:hypothetical protein